MFMSYGNENNFDTVLVIRSKKKKKNRFRCDVARDQDWSRGFGEHTFFFFFSPPRINPPHYKRIIRPVVVFIDRASVYRIHHVYDRLSGSWSRVGLKEEEKEEKKNTSS